MKFYNIIRISTVDYNGQLVTTVALSGCNFDCGYCHNYILKKKQNDIITEDEILNTIDHKMIDGICITGGEPTIYGDQLVSFVKKVKEKNKLIKLDTNGYRPEIIEILIKDKLVDYIAMDIKGPAHKYSKITGIKIDINKIFKSINIIQNNLHDYEFRTTAIPELEISDFNDIGKMIEGSKLFIIQQFFPTDLYKKNQKPISELKEIADFNDIGKMIEGSKLFIIQQIFPTDLYKKNQKPISELKEIAEIMKKYVKNVQIANI